MRAKINVYRFGTGNNLIITVTNKNVYINTISKTTRKYNISLANDLRGRTRFCNHLLMYPTGISETRIKRSMQTFSI
jgi:hypothetical protein